jgi:hypothetical protein
VGNGERAAGPLQCGEEGLLDPESAVVLTGLIQFWVCDLITWLWP